MKNKAIEAMMRVQYNLKDNDQVNVEFISCVANKYTFEITTYVRDIVKVDYIDIENKVSLF